jgi:hypothetical protein
MRAWDPLRTDWARWRSRWALEGRLNSPLERRNAYSLRRDGQHRGGREIEEATALEARDQSGVSQLEIG